MTVDEAIRVLERDRFDNPDYYLGDFQQVIDLSLEALKYIRLSRQGVPKTVPDLLPGETGG